MELNYLIKEEQRIGLQAVMLIGRGGVLDCSLQ